MQDKFANANDPRAVRSRQALHQALLTLIESKSLDQITIRDITAASGVGYTTYFRHYPTKEALFDAVAQDAVLAIFELSLPIVQSKDLRSGSAALFTYIKEHSKLWTTLLTGGAAAPIREQFLRSARAVARSMGPKEGWMPPDLGVILIVTGTIEMISWWLQQRSPPSIEEIARMHVKVVLTPAIAASNAKPPKAEGAKTKVAAASRNRRKAKRVSAIPSGTRAARQ